MIRQGFLVLSLYAVGDLATLNHLGHTALDGMYEAGDTAYEIDVRCRKGFALGTKYLLHLVYVVNKLALVLGGYGEDVIKGHVAEDA